MGILSPFGLSFQRQLLPHGARELKQPILWGMLGEDPATFLGVVGVLTPFGNITYLTLGNSHLWAELQL